MANEKLNVLLYIVRLPSANPLCVIDHLPSKNLNGKGKNINLLSAWGAFH